MYSDVLHVILLLLGIMQYYVSARTDVMACLDASECDGTECAYDVLVEMHR